MWVSWVVVVQVCDVERRSGFGWASQNSVTEWQVACQARLYTAFPPDCIAPVPLLRLWQTAGTCTRRCLRWSSWPRWTEMQSDGGCTVVSLSDHLLISGGCSPALAMGAVEKRRVGESGRNCPWLCPAFRPAWPQTPLRRHNKRCGALAHYCTSALRVCTCPHFPTLQGHHLFRANHLRPDSGPAHSLISDELASARNGDQSRCLLGKLGWTAFECPSLSSPARSRQAGDSAWAS